MMLAHFSKTFTSRRLFIAGLATLSVFPVQAQNYRDSGGSAVLGVVPLLGCSGTGSCSGPVSPTNPMPVTGLTGFQPTPAYTSLSVSTTSSSVALPQGATVVVYNTGSNTAFVTLGNSSVTATTSNDIIPPNGWMAFAVGPNTFLAAIVTSGTTTLNLSGGSGLPTGGTNNGLNLTGLIQASTSTPINISSASTMQLIAGVSGQRIYVTAWDVIAGGSGTITLEYGTQSANPCDTGTTPLTGPYPLIAQTGISKGSGLSPVFIIPAGAQLCARTSTAAQMSGSVSYTQF
jgi:hypothetical protein